MSLIDSLKKDIHYIESLNSCMNCGVCTAICPSAEFYNYDPRIIADTVQRQDEERRVIEIRYDLVLRRMYVVQNPLSTL